MWPATGPAPAAGGAAGASCSGLFSISQLGNDDRRFSPASGCKAQNRQDCHRDWCHQTVHVSGCLFPFFLLPGPGMKSCRHGVMLTVPSDRKTGDTTNGLPVCLAFSGSASTSATGRHQRRKMDGTTRTCNTAYSIWAIRNGYPRLGQPDQQRITVPAIERVSATGSFAGNLDSGTAANEVPDATGTPSPA